MAGAIDRAAHWLLFQVDPERAHRLAVRAIALEVHSPAPPPDPRLRRRLLSLDFPSPVGLAAGFDKNAEAVGGLLRLGFGFVEVGSVTPRPQRGNPPPRLFRLAADRAIVNRLGFNNDGAEAVRRRLQARTGRPGIVGVNLGANRDSADRIADYVRGVETFTRLASYLTVNISSPNTPGLRDLQAAPALADLLPTVLAARDAAADGRKTPVLVKLAPDLGEADLAAIAETALRAGVDGLVVGNTTLSREGLRPDPHAAEAGGLSGRPLFRRSTALLARLRRLVGSDLPLIGVGGIDSAETAWTKLAAGADLVQLYTGMIFEGPGLAMRLNHELARRVEREGLASIAELVGTQTDRWASEPLV